MHICSSQCKGLTCTIPISNQILFKIMGKIYRKTLFLALTANDRIRRDTFAVLMKHVVLLRGRMNRERRDFQILSKKKIKMVPLPFLV